MVWHCLRISSIGFYTVLFLLIILYMYAVTLIQGEGYEYMLSVFIVCFYFSLTNS